MIIRSIAKSSKVLYAGTKRITKLGNDRYAVYLPISMNDLWEELWKSRAKFRVYLEVVESDTSSTEE